jgi:hypothetical protein
MVAVPAPQCHIATMLHPSGGAEPPYVVAVPAPQCHIATLWPWKTPRKTYEIW